MGTGSRELIVDPNAKEVYDNTEEYLVWRHEQEVGGIHLICGLAEGFDEVIGLVGLRNNIPYDCYIPTKDYGNYYWAQHSLTKRNRIDRFNEIMLGARAVHYLEDLYHQTPKFLSGPGIMRGPNYWIGDPQLGEGMWLHANMARNEEMVKVSDMAVVYDKGSRGTRDAVARLKARRMPLEYYPFKKRLF